MGFPTLLLPLNTQSECCDYDLRAKKSSSLDFMNVTDLIRTLCGSWKWILSERNDQFGKKNLLKIFRKDNKIKKNIGFSISGKLANCSSSDFSSILSALI